MVAIKCKFPEKKAIRKEDKAEFIKNRNGKQFRMETNTVPKRLAGEIFRLAATYDDARKRNN